MNPKATEKKGDEPKEKGSESGDGKGENKDELFYNNLEEVYKDNPAWIKSDYFEKQLLLSQIADKHTVHLKILIALVAFAPGSRIALFSKNGGKKYTAARYLPALVGQAAKSEAFMRTIDHYNRYFIPVLKEFERIIHGGINVPKDLTLVVWEDLTEVVHIWDEDEKKVTEGATVITDIVGPGNLHLCEKLGRAGMHAHFKEIMKGVNPAVKNIAVSKE